MPRDSNLTWFTLCPPNHFGGFPDKRFPVESDIQQDIGIHQSSHLSVNPYRFLRYSNRGSVLDGLRRRNLPAHFSTKSCSSFGETGVRRMRSSTSADTLVLRA